MSEQAISSSSEPNTGGLQAAVEAGHVAPAPPTESRPADTCADPAAFVFKLRGEMWQLRFPDGDDVKEGWYPNWDGLAYYAYLIDCDGRDVPALELKHHRHPPPSNTHRDRARLLSAEAEAADGSGDGPVSYGSFRSQPIREELRAIYEEMRACREQIDDARQDGDNSVAAAAEQKLEELQQRLEADPDFKEKTKYFRNTSPSQKAKRAVWKAMKEALAKVARSMPRLAQHLEAATVSRPNTLAYRPAGPVPHWER